MTNPATESNRAISRPLIVFVTGPACTGKTTLAHSISERFGLPVFHKDAFKEMMFDVICPDGDYEIHLTREMSQLLGRYSLGCLEIALEQCVRNGVSAIFEANFDSRLFSPRIAAIRRKYPFRALQAHLRCRGDVLRERFVRREHSDRHTGHGGMRHLKDLELALLRGSDDPLVLDADDDIVRIDTTHLAEVNHCLLFELVTERLLI